MEKTSKITACSFKNEWSANKDENGKYKPPLTYYHNIELENGDFGNIGSREKMPDKLQVGNELTYTIENGKIKAVNKQNFKPNGGGYKPEPYEHKMAGMAFSFAKDLVIADKVKVEQIEAIAEKIYNWLINKKQN